jgi:Na+/H+ antiporter NhaA
MGHPVLAGLAGMVVPVVIYLIVNGRLVTGPVPRAIRRACRPG